ncbi:hypothetical protein WR25_18000 [Diploscapter pachys]|uniref:CC domain-containing protein n=1 Tax=Diploscapter pachys TaxID=2018661 RepID=A0A2A2JG62_9BILA|nr:hypothetical protein WR25_18000 [Diploscapter pachys]
MLITVFVLALALSVSAQYDQTPAPSACPQGMIATPAYGTTCYNGGFYFNGVCCSIACPNGQAGTPPVGGVCSTGTSLQNGVCCAGRNASNPLGICEVPDQASGPCPTDGVCVPGYACDATGANCCPVQGFDYRNLDCQLGPTIDGLCPAGYAYVFVPENNPSGMCVDLQCVPGVCPQEQRDGPCQNGQCRSGFTCYTPVDICCSSV